MCSSAFSNFWSFTLTDVLGVLISGMTLWLAYLIYQNLDVKKTHVNKQLETVFALVEEINNTLLYVQFRVKIPKEILDKIPPHVLEQNKSRSSLAGYDFSFFIIAESNPQSYGDVVIYYDIKKTLPFLHFMNNPLLPKSIAQKLTAFYSPLTNFHSFDTLSESFVSISNPQMRETTKPGTGYQSPNFAPAFKNWTAFISCAKDVKTEILNWLEKHGASDINLNHTMQSA